MKKIILLSFVIFLLFHEAFAQSDVQALYFDANDRRVDRRDSAYYFRNIRSSFSKIEMEEFYLNGRLKQTMPAISLGTGNTNGLNETWYENGNRKSELNIVEGKPEGEFNEWHENGQLKVRLRYKKGLFDGEAFSYYPNGKIKRKSVFDKGTEVDSQCYKENGEPEVCWNTFAKMPTFSGGSDKLSSYLSRNLKYPLNARRQGVSGNVYIGFTVDKQGVVRDAHLMRSVNEELDTEALRVVKAMPDWEPGIMDGEFINVWHVLPVSFRMKVR